MIRAYLDIETDGLSAEGGCITVIGVALQDPARAEMEVVQLVGHDADAVNLNDALSGVGLLYTYNGSRFDLPFIRTVLGVDLAAKGNGRTFLTSFWWRRCASTASRPFARLTRATSWASVISRSSPRINCCEPVARRRRSQRSAFPNGVKAMSYVRGTIRA